MLHNMVLNKNNLDDIFSLLAEEYKNCGGKEKINIYVVGGAAIVMNFDYRLSTMDIDAFFTKNHFLDKAKELVGEKLNLPKNWLNSDFVSTPSFTDKILNYSNLHSNYLELINVYVLEAKYLIAMKLKSSRPTGGDLDDIVKMIFELRYKKEDITFDQILNAYMELYDNFSNTYEYFISKTKEAFETPLDEVAIILGKKED